MDSQGRSNELREFINWLVKQTYNPIQEQINFRTDFINERAPIENKIRACFRGFEESYEELLERINYLEQQLAQAKSDI